MDTGIKKLPPELAEKARIELGENPDLVPIQIQAFREEIEKDPKHNFRLDDAFLLRFLRARKFNQERALELIKNYYKQRINYPGLYQKMTTSALSESLAARYHKALFEKDCNGRAILVFNSLHHRDTSKVKLEDLVAHMLLTLELLLESEDTQINGVVAIVDHKGLNLSHIIDSSPSALKQALSVTVNAFPIRYKQIHFINTYKLFDILFTLIKPFLSHKLKSRLILHGSNMASLHEHINPDILHEEIGGNTGPFDNSDWNKALVDHDETMKRNLMYGFVDNKF